MTQLTLPTAYTPLHHCHVAGGARMTDQGGWHVAAVYSDVEAEISAARERLAVCDVSLFPKLSFLKAQADTTESLPVRGVMRPKEDPHSLLCRLTTTHRLWLALALDASIMNKEGQENDVTAAYAGL